MTMGENSIYSYIISDDLKSFVKEFDHLASNEYMRENLRDVVKEACLWGREDMVIYAIDSGVLGDLKFPGGAGLVGISVEKKLYKLLDFLIDNDFNINEKDDVGYTPLYDALINEDREMINFLLKKGASMDLGSPDETSRDYINRRKLWNLIDIKDVD